MKNYLLATLCCTCVSAASACELDSIAYQMPVGNHYSYEQTKSVPGLSRELHSSGNIYLQDDGSLVMHQRQPLETISIMSEDSLRQLNAGGEEILNMSEPAISRMSTAFLAVYKGEINQLQTLFDIDLNCTSGDTDSIGETWRLRLVPVAPDLSVQLDYVEVEGSAGIERMAFRESRGDTTEIVIHSEGALD